MQGRRCGAIGHEHRGAYAQREATTHDFLFMSTQYFVTNGVAEFAQLVDA
jgi:hypothetical protein